MPRRMYVLFGVPEVNEADVKLNCKKRKRKVKRCSGEKSNNKSIVSGIYIKCVCIL